ncbi:tetratricopeptide repeat protein [Catellatospora sp. KI3]|uniref:tetratricopeptide repeat protein n=1 Tax=Catellatospora sp. KI3 TaxID=3041620 RepID=UPI002482659A|nr:tetratricopeptide repeat protein [Catellatospora sp. KI3]MDI1461281.1 tetratricopeptide repeat protein [Catellatospora sp. KI3]
MSHLRIIGGRRHDRAATALGRPELLPTVDAHRRRRGPYTGASELFRPLAERMMATRPELVHQRDIELLTIAPELERLIPAEKHTLTSLAGPAERTRFYSRKRTLRIAHGLTELLRDYLRETAEPGRVLVVENIEHADPTDAELLSVLLRRLDPALLTLVLCGGAAPVHPDLVAGLERYTVELAVTRAPAPVVTGGDAALAARYVESDCTSDVAELVEAYQRLGDAERVALHDARVAELESGDWSLRLGAIPYHLERGSDPAGLGGEALRAALDYCVDMGFYDATVDFGHRGRAVVDWKVREDLWWTYTTKMTTSLAALGRPLEAEALYDECRAVSTNPRVHQQAAYATAMLYTRHHEPERRDHQKAKGWINQAMAFSMLLAKVNGDSESFGLVFEQNGLALIETHLANPANALGLVNDGIERLDRDLGDQVHLLHRSVLVNNRARVLSGLGRLDEALADYRTVVAQDPNYPEYRFEMANLLHRMGHDEEALREYAEAIRLSPPFPEVYYNRADVLFGLGELEAALADFSYVLELDPDWLDAYVNRAGVLVAMGDHAAARADVDAGLALDPGHAHLHCLLGELAAAAGDAAGAAAGYRRALELDPALPAAWAGLAVLAFEAGDAAAAAEHLDAALAQGDDPALLYNRATALLALGRPADALRDLEQALRLAPDDPDVLAERDAVLQLV